MSIFGFSNDAKKKYSISFLDNYKERNSKLSVLARLGQDVIDPHALSNDIRVYEYNTWDSWRLIPKERPSVDPPQVLSNYTELKIQDYQLDETENFYPGGYDTVQNAWFNGRRFRQMTTATFEFYVDESYLDLFNSFYIFYSHLLETLHGREKLIVLTEKDEYIHIGRIFVDSVTDEGSQNSLSVKLTANIQPFLYLKSNISTYYSTGAFSINTDGRLQY